MKLHGLASNRANNLGRPAPAQPQSEGDAWMAMKVTEFSQLPDTLQEETKDHPKVIKHDKNDDQPGMKQAKFFGGAKAAT